jgi:hypothetical protein
VVLQVPGASQEISSVPQGLRLLRAKVSPSWDALIIYTIGF